MQTSYHGACKFLNQKSAMTQQQLHAAAESRTAKTATFMTKRKTMKSKLQPVARGNGNSDMKAHQHGQAGLMETVSYNSGHGTGAVVFAQQATPSGY